MKCLCFINSAWSWVLVHSGQSRLLTRVSRDVLDNWIFLVPLWRPCGCSQRLICLKVELNDKWNQSGRKKNGYDMWMCKAVGSTSYRSKAFSFSVTEELHVRADCALSERCVLILVSASLHASVNCMNLLTHLLWLPSTRHCLAGHMHMWQSILKHLLPHPSSVLSLFLILSSHILKIWDG